MTFEEKLKSIIRDVPDFPKPGILFKDITPLLLSSSLRKEITDNIASYFAAEQIDAVVGIESRGFIFGNSLADALQIPFVPVRKSGKLPHKTIKAYYDLEYGSASIEMHEDAIQKGWRVLIHDDLLATGGTAAAAGQLVQQAGGEVAGFSFIINLGFLPGYSILEAQFGVKPHVLVNY
ncbi:MAG TPA: adenine phosphoribosyltransferase [Cyclobacteriaceae bacterium]|mgnify:CR=1 FL=1|nr:adenine phosphoribosyltransferase [Cyclobacteriaceae bacterium]